MTAQQSYNNNFNFKKDNILWIILLGLIFIIAMIGLAGCMTSEKAVYFLKKKDLLDDTCAANYPVQEKFIKGDSVVTLDTQYVGVLQTDTLITKDTVFITRTLPPKTITKTIRTTDTIIKRDIALENVLQDRIRESYKETQDEKAKKEKYQEELNKLKDKWRGKIGIPWWVFLILGALIGLSAKFKVLRLFNPSL